MNIEYTKFPGTIFMMKIVFKKFYMNIKLIAASILSHCWEVSHYSDSFFSDLNFFCKYFRIH